MLGNTNIYLQLFALYVHMYMFKENAFRLHHDNDVLMYVVEKYVLLRYDSCLFSIVHIYENLIFIIFL